MLFLLPLAVTGVGGFFLFYAAPPVLRHPRRTAGLLSAHFGKDGRAYRSLTLALAGTLGVGNMTGVAVGLAVGGAGSVFWMLLSCLFTAPLKYCESLVTSDTDTQSGETGGMMRAAERTLPAGRFFGAIYAFLCLLLAFSMGAALQSRAVAEYSAIAFGWDGAALLALFTVWVFWTACGGVRRIERTSSLLIPLAAGVYVLLCLAVILRGAGRLPSVFSAIFRSAFTPSGAGGGILGILTSHAVSEGYAGAILSNEAGAGTSSLAHARSGGEEPVGEGLSGVLEVVADTLILCFLTALAVLVSVEHPEEYTAGLSLLADAFSSTFHGAERLPLLFCIAAFAHSTILCWYYYGRECVRYLRGGRSGFLYPLLFFAALLFVRMRSFVLARISGALLLALTLITSAVLLRRRRRIRSLTRRAYAAHRSGAGAPASVSHPSSCELPSSVSAPRPTSSPLPSASGSPLPASAPRPVSPLSSSPSAATTRPALPLSVRQRNACVAFFGFFVGNTCKSAQNIVE